ncbi:sphingoid long-chain base transporter RSB1 [Colletotrichum plurivorum]|uniref:Sphingoid long-chain base transporter RSB1 n=1 Tax=Colletotrichum plurivorum TaxID=2175906 RepID=A0A8H6KEM2_9PEZI|nr:sphingoid long-chain base transporter RSB1 [Colletotrichum plurivorum]
MSTICTLATCDLATSPWGHRPSQSAAAVFMTVSAISLLVNAAYAARSPQKHVLFAIFMSLACVLEIVGWADRAVGWSDPWAVYPFTQSKALLTIAPVFITSSVYVCLSPMIQVLGAEHSLLAPHLYTSILLPLDLLSLLLQITGLALGLRSAPSIITKSTPWVPDDAGAKVVTAGLSLHLATLCAASLLLASVLFRAAAAYRRYGYTTFHRDVGYVPLPARFRIFAAAVPSALVVMFGRLVFRIAEYAGGFRSPLALGTNAGGEGLFVGLDGFLVAYAVAALVAAHPAQFSRDGKGGTGSREAEPFVPGAGGSGTSDGLLMGEHRAHLEELSKVYQAHHEEEARLSRFERV